jgi:hypothetical protein
VLYAGHPCSRRRSTYTVVQQVSYDALLDGISFGLMEGRSIGPMDFAAFRAR